MSIVLWLAGFGLMVASFGFLLGKSENVDQPRISVDHWWPQREEPRR